MNNRYLRRVRAAISTIGIFGLASAQQIAGVLGSARATTTISGKQLPRGEDS